jgi:hypothetical protein
MGFQFCGHFQKVSRVTIMAGLGEGFTLGISRTKMRLASPPSPDTDSEHSGYVDHMTAQAASLSASLASLDPAAMDAACRATLASFVPGHTLPESIFIKTGAWAHLLAAYDASIGMERGWDLLCFVMARILFYVPRAAALVEEFSDRRIVATLNFLMANPNRPSQFAINLLCNLLPDCRSIPESCLPKPTPLTVFHLLRERPITHSDLIFIKHYSSYFRDVGSDCLRQRRHFIREVVDFLGELAGDFDFLHVGVAILFRALDHLSVALRALLKPPVSRIRTIFELMMHPHVPVAGLAIGMIRRILDALFDVVSVEESLDLHIDLADLPIPALRAHCEAPDDPLLWPSLQLLRAVCRRDCGLSLAHGIPQFLAAFVAEGPAYRLRAEAILGIVGLLAGAEVPLLGDNAVAAAHAIAPLLRVVFEHTDADGAISHAVLWGIFGLKIRFALYGYERQFEEALAPCDAEAFFDGCDELDDPELSELLANFRTMDFGTLDGLAETLAVAEAQIQERQQLADRQRPPRTIHFVYNP